MSAHYPWARLRENRAASPGRHSPDYLEKRPMPASPAASLPLQSERPDARPVAIVAARTAEPQAPAELKVQCGICGICGAPWEVADIGRGPRCIDTDACTKRQMDKLYAPRVPEVPALPAEPAPLPPSASPALEPLPKRVPAVVPEAVLSPENEPAAMTEALAPLRAQLQAPAPELPPAREAAFAAFTEASDEQDAAEAGQDRAEDEEPPEAAVEPPASDGDGAEPDAAPAVAEGSEPEDGGEGK